MAPRASLALLCALVAVVACDRRLDPWVDAADEPPPSDRPVRIPGLASPTPDPLPDLMASNKGQSIRGTLRLASGAAVAGGSVLFVIARSQAGGPPLAVKRMAPGPFPLEFEIGPRDAMMAGRPFEGAMLLSARIDADGDPLTRAPGDLAAASESPLEPGAHSVDLLLAPVNP
jgi:hypothetical protein